MSALPKKPLDPKVEDDMVTLKAMKLLSDHIDALDDKDPEKDALKKDLTDLVQMHELPAPVESPDTALLHAVDYGSGLMRTEINEPILMWKAALDKMRGVPNSWSIKGAHDRAVQALNPLDRPAESNSETLSRLGAGEMGHISSIPGMQNIVKPGGRWDITGRGALGFGLDMAESPASMEEGLSRLLGVKNAKPYENNKLLASDLEAARDKALEPSPAPGMMASAANAAKQVPDILLDPIEKIKMLALKARFATADKAAALKNKTLPSDVFAQEGGRGVTTAGIRQDFRNVIDQNEKRIDEMARGLDPANAQHTVMRGSRDASLMNDPRALAENFDPTSIDPVTGAPVDPEGASMLYPLWSPKQMQRESTIASGQGAQAARRGMERRVIEAESMNPSFQKQWLLQRGESGAPATALGPGGTQEQLFTEPPTVTTSTRPPASYQTGEEIAPGVRLDQTTNRPGKTVTNIEGTPSTNSAPISPLDLDRPVSFDELRNNRRAWQKEADVGGLYASGKDRLADKLPKDIRNVEAEAELAGNLAQHSSRLENQILDRAQPGQGGEAFLRKQDSSGLLEGSPWLDRDPVSGATTRSTQAFNPLQGRAIGTVKTGVNLGLMSAYQALRNPAVRYGLLPGARAAWLNSWVDRNVNAPENPENPWGNLYRYQEQ